MEYGKDVMRTWKTGDPGAQWIQLQTFSPGKVIKYPDAMKENVRQQ